MESSGATFRGLAVQVREATQSFDNSAEFIGQFVNPPADGDWRIWDCNSVSVVLLIRLVEVIIYIYTQTFKNLILYTYLIYTDSSRFI